MRNLPLWQPTQDQGKLAWWKSTPESDRRHFTVCRSAAHMNGLPPSLRPKLCTGHQEMIEPGGRSRRVSFAGDHQVSKAANLNQAPSQVPGTVCRHSFRCKEIQNCKALGSGRVEGRTTVPPQNVPPGRTQATRVWVWVRFAQATGAKRAQNRAGSGFELWQHNRRERS